MALVGQMKQNWDLQEERQMFQAHALVPEILLVKVIGLEHGMQMNSHQSQDEQVVVQIL